MNYIGIYLDYIVLCAYPNRHEGLLDLIYIYKCLLSVIYALFFRFSLSCALCVLSYIAKEFKRQIILSMWNFCAKVKLIMGGLGLINFARTSLL